MNESATKQKRFHLCLSCGKLRREDLFEEGDCTCEVCYSRGETEVLWLEAKDGDGFVSTEKGEKQE